MRRELRILDCDRSVRAVAIVLAATALSFASIAGAQTKTPATGAGQKPAPAPETLPGIADKSGKKTVTIKVPEAGEHFIRIQPSSDSKQPQLPISFLDTSKTITIDPAVVGKAPKIAVDDAKTGNTALIPPAGHVSADGSTVELGKIDFDHVRQVKVVVTYDGKPVQAATVTLGSDKSAATKLVDPSSQGVATFDDVPSGKSKLMIVYGDKLTESKDVEIALDHPGAYLTINAPVTNKVATLNTAPPIGTGAAAQSTQITPVPGAQGTQPAPPPHEGGGLAGFIGTIIGLAAAGGVIYLLYRWAQSGGMAATLKKAGIEVTGTPPSDAGTPWNPNAPPPPVVSDPTICQFCGQKRDQAGNCACTLSGTAINTGPASPVVATQPRLVATMGLYSGQIFPLNGAGVTVGREATNTIALGDDTTVSRRHASFRADSGRYIVTDEGSSNGIYVNGVKISGSQPLNPGDEVQIGNTRFRFEV